MSEDDVPHGGPEYADIPSSATRNMESYALLKARQAAFPAGRSF